MAETPLNEFDRLRALHSYAILDSGPELEFDRLTELASIICDTPISTISLIAENRQWFKSKIGLSLTETPREHAFCGLTILGEDVFEVEDATYDERFKNNPLVTSDPKIRFYAGFPLIDPNGYAIGSLCVIDREPKVLNSDQKRALKLLSAEVIALIVERRKKEELENFEKLFDLSNDLVFIGGTDGYFKKVNPAFTKVLGWDKQFLLKTSSFEFYHPDDIQKTLLELKNQSTGKHTTNFLQRFKTAWGYYKTIEWTSTPETATGYIFGIGRDVSEEILKEQMLAENEEKLRIFFENSQGLMCTHDLEGNFLSVNQAGAKILGYTVDEVMRFSLFDIVPAPRHKMVHEYLAEIKLNGAAKGQMVTLHKDGSMRIWMFNNALQTAFGADTYVIANAIDITERHRLEEKLKRTSQMLEQTNQVARVGGWEYDLRRGDILWTTVTKEIHGVPQDYVPDLETAISFYKEGESRERITEALSKTMTDGIPWDEELQIIDAQGNEVWVRALGEGEFEDGKCVRLYGTFQDIDIYKQSELALKRSVENQEKLNNALLDHIELIEQQDKTIEKIQEFKFLADSIPQMVWTSKSDGSVDYYNQHWFNYTGLDPELTDNDSWDQVVHPDDVKADAKIWRDAIKVGKPYQSELRFKRAADGIYRWHVANAIPMKDSRGKVIKWFGSSTDIDAYKRALDLENRISQFEDFNRIVAHNLRGPAASIQLILGMISEDDTKQESADYLAMLKQSSDNLIESLNELMKVLEIRNNQDLPFETCNFTSIVNSVEGMLRGQIVAKQAVITTNFEVPSMQFPKMYLDSIFYNMISNALKYSKADTAPRISISSARERGKLVLRFNDNGIGIDLAKHGKNMFKLNHTFHTGFDSKGVGLFMTKTQIETFGGQISVKSEPGIGSTFTIEFK